MGSVVEYRFGSVVASVLGSDLNSSRPQPPRPSWASAPALAKRILKRIQKSIFPWEKCVFGSVLGSVFTTTTAATAAAAATTTAEGRGG